MPVRTPNDQQALPLLVLSLCKYRLGSIVIVNQLLPPKANSERFTFRSNVKWIGGNVARSTSVWHVAELKKEAFHGAVKLGDGDGLEATCDWMAETSSLKTPVGTKRCVVPLSTMLFNPETVRLYVIRVFPTEITGRDVSYQLLEPTMGVHKTWPLK